MKNTRNTILGTFVIAVTLFAPGCVTTPVSPARLASAKAAIRAAHEVGAADTPRAALHLRLATDQFVLAEKLIRKDENERAQTVLLRAEADAELAVALSRDETSRAGAQHAVDNVRALQTQVR